MTSPLSVTLEHGGSLLRLQLSRPKANIVDAEMIGALSVALAEHRDLADLKAVILGAEGPHFSFGASVEEHLPGQCADMLKSLHALVLDMVGYSVPILVAVQGQCLGGGLEVAMAGTMIFAAPDAGLGQPEIKLSVIAPAASVLLPEKIGRTQAADILLSGRTLSAEEAHGMGLVNVIADDPAAAAELYFTDNLAPLSAAVLRHAVSAARIGVIERVQENIAKVEALYLDDVMSTADAVEGLNAFLEKRAATWENR